MIDEPTFEGVARNQRKSQTFYTIGHSTRALDELIALLSEHGVRMLADVRRFPGSRRHPQFNGEALGASLEARGITRVHLEELGGRRTGSEKSPNTAWRNASFRAYADHMESAAFRSGVDRLEAVEAPLAIMCAEAVPWRCHRHLISDELVRRGHRVIHIIGPGSVRKHTLNANAIDAGGHLIYPEGGARQTDLPLDPV